MTILISAGILLLVFLGWLTWAWKKFLDAFQIELEPNQPMPDLNQVPYETWHIPTGNSKIIRGWMLLQPASPNAPIVIVAHGWTRNATFLWPISYRLWKEGYQVFAINARNHGECDLDPPMSVLKYTEDLENTIHWLRLRFPGNLIAMTGHSLGGAALLIASVRVPDIAAAVPVCAFSRSDRIFEMDIRRAGVPMVPVGKVILALIGRYLGHSYDELAPAVWVRNSRVPTLLIGAGLDTRVPPGMQYDLKAAFPEGVAFGPVIEPEASHTSLLTDPGTIDRIIRFLNRRLKQSDDRDSDSLTDRNGEF